MSAGQPQSDKNILFSIELLTVQQVADWAKVSTKTVYRWIDAGELPAIRFGRRTFRIPVKTVIEYLQKAGYENLISTSPSE